MNDVIQFEQHSQVCEQASLWLVRLQEGLEPEQKDQLQAWIDEDEAHGERLLELASYWDDMAILTELAPLFNELPANKKAKSSDRYWLNSAWPKIAACVLGLAVASLLVIQNKHQGLVVESDQRSQLIVNRQRAKAKQQQEYKTRLGERNEVLLSDGSIATLNTDTHIVVNYTKSARNIKLLKGEAHFAVYKDSSRPLSVVAADKEVRAVGTAFSVRKNQDGYLQVAVNEGLVAVYEKTGISEAAANKNSLRSLAAGQVLTITSDSHDVVQYDSAEMEDRLAWKKGMIVINDETLDYVVAEFGRYSQKKILLADKKMGEIRVAGYFKLGDVDALLLALEQNFGIGSVYYETDDIFILSRI